MDTKTICTRLMAALFAIALLALAQPTWATIGQGELFVDPPGTVTAPNHWDVLQSQQVTITIPGADECSATQVFIRGHAGTCSTDTECMTGTCSNNSLISCNLASQCPKVKGGSAPACIGGDASLGKGKCDTSDSGGGGSCKFVDVVTGNETEGFVYTTRGDACRTAVVAYCGKNPGTYIANADIIANLDSNGNGGTIAAATIRHVDANGDTIQCGGGERNHECDSGGAICCTLTQGAYGANNGIATSRQVDCSLSPAGLIPAAACAGNNVFASDGNATTIGLHDDAGSTQSVTIGPNNATGGTLGTGPSILSGSFPTDLTTLIAYLPTGGTAGSFNSSVVGDQHYDNASQIPDLNTPGTQSAGQGAGVLAGQAMTCSLNVYLQDVANIWAPTSTGGPLGSYTFPSFVCTKNHLQGATPTPVCQAFSYPSCVVGHTVTGVQTATDNELDTAGTNGLSCSASDLTQALDNFNRQFDECGQVITCPTSTSGSPGTGTCNFMVGFCDNASSQACTTDSDCNVAGVFACPA